MEKEREWERGAIKERGSRIRCNFCKSPSGHKSRLAIKVVRFRPSVSHGPFARKETHLKKIYSRHPRKNNRWHRKKKILLKFLIVTFAWHRRVYFWSKFNFGFFSLKIFCDLIRFKLTIFSKILVTLNTESGFIAALQFQVCFKN